MKTVRKLLGIAFLLAMLVGCLVFHVSALGGETDLDTPGGAVGSGYCGGKGDGTNLTWTLDSEGTLTISGSGVMSDFSSAENAPWYSMNDSVKNVIIGDNVTNISRNAFKADWDRYTKLTTVIIGNGVKTIGDRAFDGCSGLTSVTIGDSVTTIGDSAFHRCSGLTSVTIGDSVTTIGSDTFSYCWSLTSVEIPGSVTTIGESAFYSCRGLTSVTIPDSVTTIGESAFYSCQGLTSVTIPDSVTTIRRSAFSWCTNLTTVDIPDSVTTIRESAFYSCQGLTSVTIPDSVISIGYNAFRNCYALTSVEIPDSVTAINDNVFSECTNLSSVKLGSGVEYIDSGAFRYCQSLTTVTIPDSVTEIWDNAFRDCYNLEAVYFEGNAPSTILGAGFGYDSFDAATVTLYYIPGTTGWTDSDAYDVATGTWNGYKLQAWGQGDIDSVGHLGNSLSLEGLVYINHYATVSGDVDRYYVQANGGLLIWKTKPALANATYEKAEIRKTGLVWDETNQAYRQQTDGIPAKEFADELYLRTYIKTGDGGYVYGDLKEYSVQDYCESRIKNSTNEKMKALAAATLHYGASAQTYFGYHTDDLANKTITRPVDTWNANLLDSTVSYTTAPTPAATGDVKIVGQSLSLEGMVLVNYYFNPASGQTWNVVSGELQVWEDTTDLSGNPTYKKALAYNVDMQAWRGQSNGFVAKEYSKTIYARAKLVDENGNVHYSKVVTYSPETYAKSRINNSTNANMVELAKRLVMYGERARLYFAK